MSKELWLIDSHAHVQFPAYNEDREAVIQRALGGGVGMINVGTQYKTSEDAVRIAGEHDGLWATVGFHPSHADENAHHDPWELAEKNGDVFDCKRFLELAKSPKVVAVGECGLDYAVFVRKRSEREQKRASAEALGEGGLPLAEIERIKAKQQEVFIQQIELALEIGKPLAIHCRPSAGTQDAYDDAFRVLNSYFLIPNSNLRGVMHFFVGNIDTAKKFLDLGFYISFAGPITFAKEYEEVVRFVPLDRILVETDAPYAAPAPYRGRRNEPGYVQLVAGKIAALKKIDFEEISQRTLENTCQLFGV